MAETLLSPGVLTRENDQSQVTQGPIAAGAAIVGPTVKGPVNIPTLVTSYSDYISKFGGSFISGGTTQEYLTSISAFNYFQQGGDSLLVTRVVSGDFAPATSTKIYNNAESGILNTAANSLLTSFNNVTASAGTYNAVAATGSLSGAGAVLNVTLGTTGSISSVSVVNGGSGFAVGETLTVPASLLTGTTARGVLTSSLNALLDSFNNITASAGTYTSVGATGSLSGRGAVLNFTLDSDTTISSVTATSGGSGFVDGEVLTVPAALLNGTTFRGILSSEVNALSSSFTSVKAFPKSYTGLQAVGSLSGTGAVLDVTLDTTSSIATVTVTSGGLGFVDGEVLTVGSALLDGTTAAGILSPATNALVNAFTSVTASAGTYTAVGATGSLAGVGAVLDVVLDTTGSVSSVNVINSGSGFVAGEILTVPSSSLNGTTARGILSPTPNALSSSFTSVKAFPKSYTGLQAVGSLSGTGAVLDVTLDTTSSIATVTVTSGGLGFVDGEVLTVGSALLDGTTAAGILSPATNALVNAFTSVTASAGTYDALGATGSLSGVGAVLNVVLDTTGSVSSVAVVNGGSGFVDGEILTVPSSFLTGSIARGALILQADALLNSFTSVSASVGTYDDVAATGSLSGTGVLLDVTLDTETSISSVTVVTSGTGFVVGEELSVPAALLGGGPEDLIFTLVEDDFISEKSDLTFTLTVNELLEEKEDLVFTIVENDLVSEKSDLTFTLTSNDLLSERSDLTFTLTPENIVNSEVFELETLSEGAIMNSGTATGSNGSLVNGSVENLRFEIVNANTGSGVFSLLIRRGNDTDNSKAILESWSNLSLDPNSQNYIEAVIGNQTVDVSEGYTNVSGDFTNKSRYVRVKSVSTITPNYFDNNGVANSAYTSSIPYNQTGSFVGATGNLSGVYGLTGSDYTSSLALLSNKDEFRYNVITIPGLTQADNSDAVAVLLTSTTERGDAIAVVDLTGESANLLTAIDEAASLDNSYAATYWPWVQVNAPNTGKLTWVPASTIIPSVYAFNDRVAAPWFAPAGFSRGGLNVIQAKRKLSPADRDALYAANINSIATFPGQGVVAYGQKTLQKKASALDRVNVRRLLIELKSYIGQVANTLVFEQNSNATRNRFLAQTNPYLESIQQRQGLYAYKVVMDDTNNTADVIDRHQ